MKALGTPMSKAIAVAVLHLLLVSTLGAKLLYDRHTRPQAWFLAQRYDPNLPIRGRYLSLQMEVNDPRTPEELEHRFGSEIQLYNKQAYRGNYDFGRECGSIVMRGNQPAVEFDNSPSWSCDNLTFVRLRNGARTTLRLAEPVLFFIPDTARDPIHLKPGDEMWVLATIPRKGPPRPIVLGIKTAGGQDIRQLDLN